MSNEPSQPVKQIGKYTVKIVRNACISASSCVAVSPTVFDLDEENIAKFVDNPHDEEDNILLAAQSCPTNAIIIEETATGKQIWPEA